ncbi:MAG: M23 family metallopeptidase [Oscillospiraceae bacterium]|nr:M23 family metallopeptidase [Oscillospiraceae bacterium]
MALPAAASAALKKLAASAATDKNVAKTIGGIVLGVLIVLVTPILAIIAILRNGAQMDLTAMAANAKNEQLAYFEQVMLAIEDEITAQGLQTDPLRAQMIYLCALRGREREDGFYTIYIGCFAGEQDAYTAIGEIFGVTFTEDNIAKIEQLIGMAQQAQAGPSNNLHAQIAELTADDGTPLPEGAFLCPLRIAGWKSLITSGFGMRVHPISGERKFHTGLDIRVDEGTPLYPAQAGKVLIVGSDASYGNYVVVYYGGGMATLYAHCLRILVSEGLDVTTETMIARSGNTGNSTGPHVHVEVILDGTPQNPKKYIK